MSNLETESSGAAEATTAAAVPPEAEAPEAERTTASEETPAEKKEDKASEKKEETPSEKVETTNKDKNPTAEATEDTSPARDDSNTKPVSAAEPGSSENQQQNETNGAPPSGSKPTTAEEEPSAEEARLRERLLAKKRASMAEKNGSDKKKPKTDETSSPSSDKKKEEDHHRSSSKGGRSLSPDRKEKNGSGSSSHHRGREHHRHRGRSPPHHHRNRHRDDRHSRGHHHHGRDYPPPDRRGSGRGGYGGPPPGWRGGDGPYPQDRRGSGGSSGRLDDFGRQRRRRSSSRDRSRDRRGPARSRSQSKDSSSHNKKRRGRRHRSRSRSYSSGGSYSSRSRSRGRGRSRSRSRSSSSGSSRSSYSSSSESSQSSHGGGQEDAYTKDQRTVFVNQLVMRATARDLKKYLQSKGIKVRQVEFLFDKRTQKHKGGAYVELRRIEDVAAAVALSGQVPDFQRFPILVKASEAEKNYLAAASGVPGSTVLAGVGSTALGTTPAVGGGQVAISPNAMTWKTAVVPPPAEDADGRPVESQKVYLGSLDPTMSLDHLRAILSPLGTLLSVMLQMDSATGMSKGFAFVSFAQASEANLAIHTLSGRQVLAGRPLKTGWAKQSVPSKPGMVQVVTSEEFPPGASERTTRAYQVLAQINMGVAPAQILLNQESGTASTATMAAATISTPASAPPAVAPTGTVSKVATVADARASLMAPSSSTGLPVPTVAPVAAAPPLVPAATSTVPVGNADNPTKTVLVHNMFDKDQETEPGWAKEIADEFQEECSKYGPILKVKVMSEEPGGRWFDKRQLRTEFVSDDEVPADK